LTYGDRILGANLTRILLPEKGYRLLLLVSLYRPSIFVKLFSIRGLAPGNCSVTHGTGLLRTQLLDDVIRGGGGTSEKKRIIKQQQVIGCDALDGCLSIFYVLYGSV
jgi:hypothetical protein